MKNTIYEKHNFNLTSSGSEKNRMYDKFHGFMCLRKNGLFTPWLKPGEQKQL